MFRTLHFRGVTSQPLVWDIQCDAVMRLRGHASGGRVITNQPKSSISHVTYLHRELWPPEVQRKGRKQHSHTFQLGIISKHQIHCNNNICFARDLIFYTIWRFICQLKMCMYLSYTTSTKKDSWKVNTEQTTCTLLRNRQGLNLKKKTARTGTHSINESVLLVDWLSQDCLKCCSRLDFIHSGEHILKFSWQLYLFMGYSGFFSWQE